jgi:hypothetical protein
MCGLWGWMTRVRIEPTSLTPSGADFEALALRCAGQIREPCGWADLVGNSLTGPVHGRRIRKACGGAGQHAKLLQGLYLGQGEAGHDVIVQRLLGGAVAAVRQPSPLNTIIDRREGSVGALIDKIAASGNMSSYARPAQSGTPTTALRAANALALDLTEDLRDLGLDIFVLWEGNSVKLGSPGGIDFSFIAKSRDAHSRSVPIGNARLAATNSFPK